MRLGFPLVYSSYKQRITHVPDLKNGQKQMHSHTPTLGLSGKPFSSIKSLDSLSNITGLWTYPHFKALNSPRKGQERLYPPREIWVEFEGWVRGHLAQVGSVRQPGNQRNGQHPSSDGPTGQWRQYNVSKGGDPGKEERSWRALELAVGDEP